jgi:hypothetical protein
MSLRAVVGLVVMQNFGFAVMGFENGWWDLGCVELLCCIPAFRVSKDVLEVVTLS